MRNRSSQPARSNLVLLGLFHLCLWHAAQPTFAVETWSRWEQSLTSSKAYGNPYREVTLKVSYHGPDQQQITGVGFWDGGNTFKIRTMFPVPGHWKWETSCSDTENGGLHSQSGSVEVVRCSGDNSLYTHGYLKLAANHRHLAYADDTPFLWIGDTAWATPMNTPWDDWQTYVRDRVAKKFTVLQVFCASDWAGTNDWKANPPFVGEGLIGRHRKSASHSSTLPV